MQIDCLSHVYKTLTVHPGGIALVLDTVHTCGDGRAAAEHVGTYLAACNGMGWDSVGIGDFENQVDIRMVYEFAIQIGMLIS